MNIQVDLEELDQLEDYEPRHSKQDRKNKWMAMKEQMKLIRNGTKLNLMRKDGDSKDQADQIISDTLERMPMYMLMGSYQSQHEALLNLHNLEARVSKVKRTLLDR